MNVKSLSDDVVDDIEFNCLVNKIAADDLSESFAGMKTHSSSGSRRAIDSFLEDKLLREQIQDPLFDAGYY